MRPRPNAMKNAAPIHELAARIRQSIADYGVCAMHDTDFDIIWSHIADDDDNVKRMQMMNFAAHYGFKVYLNPTLTGAVFHRAAASRATGV